MKLRWRAVRCTLLWFALVLSTQATAPSRAEADDDRAIADHDQRALTAREERITLLNATLATQGSTCRVLGELPGLERLAVHCRRSERLAETLSDDPALCAELHGLGFVEAHVRTAAASTQCTLASCRCAQVTTTPPWAAASAEHRHQLIERINLDAAQSQRACRAAAIGEEATTVALDCLELPVDEIVSRYVAADTICPTWQAHHVAQVRAMGRDGELSCDVASNCRCTSVLASGPTVRADDRRAITRRIAQIDARVARGAAADALAASQTLLLDLETAGLITGPLVADALAASARTAHALGDDVSAHALYARALEALEGSLPAAHPTLDRARCALGAAELSLERTARAERRLRAASAALLSTLGADHPETVRCQVEAARATAALDGPTDTLHDALLAGVGRLEPGAERDRAARRELVALLVELARLEPHPDAAAARLDHAQRWLAPLTDDEGDRLRALLQAERARLAESPADALQALTAALSALPTHDPARVELLQALAALAPRAPASLAAAALETIAAQRTLSPPEAAPLVLHAAARWRLTAGDAPAAVELADEAHAALVARGLESSVSALDALAVATRARLRLGLHDEAAARLFEALATGRDVRRAILRHAPRDRRVALAALLEHELLPLALELRAAAPELAAQALIELHGATLDAALPLALPDDDPRPQLATRLAPRAADLLAMSSERRTRILSRLAELDPDAADTPLDVATLAATLPAGSALLTFVRTDERYLAALIAADEVQTEWLEFGAAEPLDAAIAEAWQTAPRCEAPGPAPDALHAMLVEPLSASRFEHLLIVPDGLVGLAPLPALRDADGVRLAERLRLSFVSTPRELLEAVAERAPSDDTASLDIAETRARLREPTAAPPTSLLLGCHVDPARGLTLASGAASEPLATLLLAGTRTAWVGPCLDAEDAVATDTLARSLRQLDRALARAGVRSRIIAPRAISPALLEAYQHALSRGLDHAAAHQAVVLGATTCAGEEGYVQLYGDWRAPAAAARATLPTAVAHGGCACTVRAEEAVPAGRWPILGFALALGAGLVAAVRRRRRAHA